MNIRRGLGESGTYSWGQTGLLLLLPRATLVPFSLAWWRSWMKLAWKTDTSNISSVHGLAWLGWSRLSFPPHPSCPSAVSMGFRAGCSSLSP